MKHFIEKMQEDLIEALKVVKMNSLANSKEFNLQWYDKFSSGHDLCSRISRTKLTRKEAIDTIIRGIDESSSTSKQNEGVFVIDFKKSEFFSNSLYGKR